MARLVTSSATEGGSRRRQEADKLPAPCARPLRWWVSEDGGGPRNGPPRLLFCYREPTKGPTLRTQTFPTRARCLRELTTYLMKRKEDYYALNALTGATRRDGWVDIEGGIGTLFAYSSMARRELPDERFLPDGKVETLGKGGTVGA